MRRRLLPSSLWLVTVLLGCGDDGAAAVSGEASTGSASTSTSEASTTGGESTSSGGSATSGDATGSGTATTGGTSGDPGGSTAATTGTASDGGSSGEVFECGTFMPWNDGTACPEPDITVQRYGANTFILRQSLCTSFEGPFMFMLFGQERVLLEDTGAGGIPIADAVQSVIDTWLEENGKDSIELVVANSHAHGDHVAGNTAVGTLDGATMVGTTVGSVSAFFGIDPWPTDVVTYDLGGRELEIIPIPGHQATHIAIWDPEERIVLTGDTLYPGRLYISDFDAYGASIERLVERVGGEEVCWVLGTHVEMTQSAGVDYPFGADEHPNEHPLQLQLSHLLELQSAIAAMTSPAYEVHDDFIIYPL